MKLSRGLALKIHFLIDECIPPILRDSKWFIPVLFKLVFKDQAHLILEFKRNAFNMTVAQYANTYKTVKSLQVERETDLNEGCTKEILRNIVGSSILEVGCGKGFLAKKMSEEYRVTAADIVIDQDLSYQSPTVNFIEADIERLPFQNKAFETVICTHTLEHVRNIFSALAELRRVAKRRLIIVVPKQRPYKYTFDLHLQFFPYEHSLLAIMGGDRGESCKEIDGDLFYIEDIR